MSQESIDQIYKEDSSLLIEVDAILKEKSMVNLKAQRKEAAEPKLKGSVVQDNRNEVTTYGLRKKPSSNSSLDTDIISRNGVLCEVVKGRKTSISLDRGK